MNFIFTLALISLTILIMVFTAWVESLCWMTFKDKGDNRVWVTFWQFRKVFGKYEHEIHSSQFWKNDLVGPGHYLDESTIKVNDNLFYFYTPVGYLMYVIYKISFVQKHKVKTSKSKNFTTYSKIKKEL